MSEPGTIYWEHLEPVWRFVSIYDGGDIFLHEFKQLSRREQTLFAAHWCQSEICNGGFHQFFLNPTGVLAPEAAGAFQELGLPEAASLIQEAMAFFGDPYPRDQERRAAALEAVPGSSREEWDPFRHLDDPFYAVIDWPNNVFATAADTYALRTAAQQP
jgi:hypothetical protein